MKRVNVALDACIPERVVRMLQSGFGDQGFDFIWEPRFAPGSTPDESWAIAFRRFGGNVVITGDKNIAKRPHQILAFKENGLICFFCQNMWAQQDMTFKCAHILVWWPRIQLQLREARPKDCWWIPMGLRNAPFKEVKVPDSAQKKRRQAPAR